MIATFSRIRLLAPKVLKFETKFYSKRATKPAEKHVKSKKEEHKAHKHKEEHKAHKHKEEHKHKEKKGEKKDEKKDKKKKRDSKADRALAAIEKIKKKYTPKAVNIGIIGVDGRAGKAAALYLKQNPIVRKLFLYGCKNVPYLTKDLSYIDTRATVDGFYKKRDMPRVLRAADIVLIMDFGSRKLDLHTKFEKVAAKLYHLARACATHAPRAFIIICVEPVCCTVPLFDYVLKTTPFYHPGRLAGCVAPLLSRMNNYAARYLDLDPDTVHLPLLGGPDPSTVVPLISLMEPNPMLTGGYAKRFFKKLIKEASPIPDNLKKKKTLLCEGHAITQFTLSVANGLTGSTESISPALVRCNSVPLLRNCICTARFGFGGIIQNYGVPRLSRLEMAKFESSIIHLQKREKMVYDFMEEHFKPDLKTCANM